MPGIGAVGVIGAGVIELLGPGDSKPIRSPRSDALGRPVGVASVVMRTNPARTPDIDAAYASGTPHRVIAPFSALQVSSNTPGNMTLGNMVNWRSCAPYHQQIVGRNRLSQSFLKRLPHGG